MRPQLLLASAIAALAAAVPASAAETISYSYDARGRLVKVVRSGPVDTTTTYVIDQADNRTSKTTSSP